MQSRRQSLVEVCTNTAAGMVGSWVICYLAMIAADDRAVAAGLSVVGCTIWSLVRGYWIRRLFAASEAAT